MCVCVCVCVSQLLTAVCVYVRTCVCADMLNIVVLAVGEVAALVAREQLAREVITKVLLPVVPTHCGVRTDSAPTHTHTHGYSAVRSQKGPNSSCTTSRDTNEHTYI